MKPFISLCTTPAMLAGVLCLAGPPGGNPPRLATQARLDLLASVQGNKLVLVLGGTADPLSAAHQFAGRFGPGPLVVGPVVPDLYAAANSAAAACSQ